MLLSRDNFLTMNSIFFSRAHGKEDKMKLDEEATNSDELPRFNEYSKIETVKHDAGLITSLLTKMRRDMPSRSSHSDR